MLDVVVSFDTTGSMSPCIAEVRRRVSEFTHEIFTRIGDVRLGIIAHGDYCDHNNPYVIRHTNGLSMDEAEIQKFINTVPNTGGGDADECYEYVLHEVKSFNWRPEADKIFLLIADASPHSPEYVARYYPRIYSHPLDWMVEAKELVGMGVKIYPIQCLVYSPGSFYKKLAALSDTPYLELHQFKDALEAILLVALRSNGAEQQYIDELSAANRLNRGLADFINKLRGENEKQIEVAETVIKVGEKEFRPVSLGRFQSLHVDKNTSIKEFVENTGVTYKIGRGFYELTKPETVQENKEVILEHKITGDMFTGGAVRDFIKLPYGTRGKLTVRDVPYPYRAYVQSTSVNRKLIGGTRFLYEVA